MHPNPRHGRRTTRQDSSFAQAALAAGRLDQQTARLVDDRFGRDPEVAVQGPGRPGRTEAAHPDQATSVVELAVPAETQRGFAAHAHRTDGAEHAHALGRVLRAEQFPARHRDHRGRRAGALKFITHRRREHDLRAGGQQRDPACATFGFCMSDSTWPHFTGRRWQGLVNLQASVRGSAATFERPVPSSEIWQARDGRGSTVTRRAEQKQSFDLEVTLLSAGQAA